jgi:hypothetical protein
MFCGFDKSPSHFARNFITKVLGKKLNIMDENKNKDRGTLNYIVPYYCTL